MQVMLYTWIHSLTFSYIRVYLYIINFSLLYIYIGMRTRARIILRKEAELLRYRYIALPANCPVLEILV